MPPDPAPAMIDPAADALMALLASATGNARLAAARSPVLEKLRGRLAATRLATVADYLTFLQQGDRGRQELDVLIALLTVGETFFFRQREHFDALRDVVLPALLERNKATRQFRIWSAGCANGAEPYSIAVLLYSLLGEDLGGWNVTIVGSDINRAALKEAEAAAYSAWSLRGLDKLRVETFFEKSGGVWSLRDGYRRCVRFVHHNLVRDPVPSPAHHIHSFDIVFCRNVLLYFDEASAAAATAALAAALVDDGLLFVAPTDASARLDAAFAPEKTGALYRKRPMWSPAHAARPSTTASPKRPVLRRQPAATAHRAPKTRPRLPIVRPDVAAILAVADRGGLAEAGRMAAALLAAEPLNAEAHYCEALLQQAAGELTAAEASLKRALYLDREFALARYRLAMLRASAGDDAAARKELTNVVDLLAGSGDRDQVGPGDDLDAGSLRALALHQIEHLGGG